MYLQCGRYALTACPRRPETCNHFTFVAALFFKLSCVYIDNVHKYVYVKKESKESLDGLDQP